MSKFNSQAFDDSLDEEGYLLILDRWDESVAVELACRENKTDRSALGDHTRH